MGFLALVGVIGVAAALVMLKPGDSEPDSVRYPSRDDRQRIVRFEAEWSGSPTTALEWWVDGAHVKRDRVLGPVWDETPPNRASTGSKLRLVGRLHVPDGRLVRCSIYVGDRLVALAVHKRGTCDITYVVRSTD